MTARRYTHALPTPTLAQRDPDAPTPCLGNSTPFDLLIDNLTGWEYRYALREANTMCGACPVRARCHSENADEAWVQALNTPIRTRPCEACGKSIELKRNGGDRRRFCHSACFQTAKRAKKKAAA